jgi:hypothetical protein
LDKHELAALLESLCERPFTGADDARALPAAHRLAQALADTDTAAQDGADGETLEALAAILSGTATEAQCRAFQEAAAVSAALRAEAQSALGFIAAVAEAPQPAPAHLIEEVLPAQPRPSGGLSARRWRLWRSRLRYASAAAVAVVLVGGLSVPLLWQTTTGDVSTVVPVSTGPTIAVPRSDAGYRPASTLDVAPAASPAVVPQAARKALPLPVEATAQAAPDPCGAPGSLGKSAAASETHPDTRIARSASSAQPRTTAGSAPAMARSGCADLDRASRAAQAPVQVPARAEPPATLSNRSFDLPPFAAPPAAPGGQPPAAAFAPQR